MANVYPPSPAPSACDSLADIEDLDAFLEAQGQLSHWPTPPPMEKDEDVVVDAYECDSDSEGATSDDEADAELWRIGVAFTDLWNGDRECGDFDHEIVAAVLHRAQVSPAVLALAFNTLRAVAPLKCSPHDFPPPDLAVVSALHLATAFTSDRPPRSASWAQDVSKGTWTAHQIDTTVLRFLAYPDLQMLTLSSPDAIDAAMRELCDIARGAARSPRAEVSPRTEGKGSTRQEPPAPLNLDIDVERTQWVNGTFTPAETPVAEEGPWLRLL